MSRVQSSVPSKSNALRMPVPVITHTRVPSVTGDGVDMFCFRCLWLPPPSGRCQSERARRRGSTHHRCRLTPCVVLQVVGDVEEDAIAPDDRRRARPRRHRQLPGDVLGLRPRDRQVLLAADAVARRAAPLRPVLGTRRGDGAAVASKVTRRRMSIMLSRYQGSEFGVDGSSSKL